MLQIAVPSVLQQSTVSIGMMIVQAVVNPFGTCRLLQDMRRRCRVERMSFSDFVSIGNAVSPYVSQNGAGKPSASKRLPRSIGVG